MGPRALTWKETCRRRLRAQHLHTRLPAASLHRMVADICGLHAQVMSSAELAAAVRLDGLTAGTVATALWSDRSLVKAWAMRGTLHLLTTEDYPLYAAALSNRRFDLDAPWLKYHGLLASDVPALIDAVSDALDGRQLIREELGGEVVRRLGDSKWETLLASGWGAVLKPVAFQGRLCFGPSEGNRVTFVRPDQWLGPFERLDPVEALAEVARRFLAAYGPARVEEFARWWGVQPKAVRPVLTADHGFVQVEVENARPAWTVPDAPAVTAEDAPVVRLLPLFDPYTVALRRDGERPLAGPEKDLVYRKAGWISPVLLVDGQIAGVWEHREERGGLRVDISPFGGPLASPIADLASVEARRLAEYLGVSGDITVGGFVAGRGRKNLRRLSTPEEAPA
jgi:hypothetical protein